MRALLPYALLALLLVLWPDRARRTADRDGGLALQQALRGADLDGFHRAEAPRTFTFPADHGPHPGFRTEWWYLVGQLSGEDGWRGGFQFTLFDQALRPTPPVPPRSSPWACDSLVLLHLGLCTEDRFRSFEQFARNDGQSAGVQGEPRIRVWCHDSSLELDSDGAWLLHCVWPDTELELRLEPRKDPVLQGDGGLSVKSGDGAASYYYSQTRLVGSGVLRGPQGTRNVHSSAWLDREWSTSALGAEQVGWDWFALQLDDGRDLMLYRMRRRDGSTDPTSHGCLIAADGSSRTLCPEDFTMEVLETWRSPLSGRSWPLRWRLTAPGLALIVEPLRLDQEHRGRLPYWEGAILLRDADRREVGRGYLELTGY